MKKQTQGFTLVELIVVITILAILGTIAFISLQGYSQNAKNAKVSQDLNTLASAIEISLTDGTLSSLNSLVTGDTMALNGVSSSSHITLYNDDNIASTGALDGIAVQYEVGSVDFATLRQNGDDFKDADGHDYIASVAHSGSTAHYQLAGQQRESSGTFLAIIKGSYIAQSGDTPSLISAKGSQTAITNNGNLGTIEDDTNFY